MRRLVAAVATVMVATVSAAGRTATTHPSLGESHAKATPERIADYDALFKTIDAIDDEARGWTHGVARRGEFQQREVERAAYRLWCYTGSPEPLRSLRRFELVGHWPEVVSAYRRLATDAQKNHVSFADFVRANLHKTTTAVDSERCWQAIHVIRWWIRLPGSDNVGRNGGAVSSKALDLSEDLTATSRRQAADAVARWFSANADALVWDGAASDFAPSDGKPLSFLWSKWTPVRARDAKK